MAIKETDFTEWMAAYSQTVVVNAIDGLKGQLGILTDLGLERD